MTTTKKKPKGGPDPVDIHVGLRLRMRRSILGISQDKLAKSVGLTFQQIQKYERGTNRVSAGRLYQFAKLLDVPVIYFYEQLGEQPEIPPSFSQRQFEIIQLIDRVDNDTQKSILQLLRTISVQGE